MNKSDLVTNVIKATDVTKKQAEDAVDAVLNSVVETLAKGEKAALYAFGTFEVRNRKAREGRNPQTGETIQIPASKTVGFKPAKAFKEALK